MALARIFSRYPEQTTALTHQLEQQGYRVEVLSPDEAPATLADLEIQLEVCDPAEVLHRAAELAARLHADIAVAPGALPATPPEVAEQESSPAVAAFSAAAPKPTAVSAVLPREMEIHTDEAQPERPNRLAGVARAFGAALATGAAGAGEFLSFARAAFREQLEQARVGAAEAHSRRQERLLELIRRRAEAHQHAAVLENSRRALAGYLLQLQREYPDVQMDSGNKPNLPAQRSVRSWLAGIPRMQAKKWEVVLAGVVSAIALFAAGLAVSSFHSRPAPPPNPGATLQSGGVTLPGAQSKPAPPARPSPAVRKTAIHKITPKPAMQARHMLRQTPQRNQEAVANDVVVRHFATTRPTPPAHTDGWKHFSDTSN